MLCRTYYLNMRMCNQMLANVEKVRLKRKMCVFCFLFFLFASLKLVRTEIRHTVIHVRVNSYVHDDTFKIIWSLGLNDYLYNRPAGVHDAL